MTGGEQIYLNTLQEERTTGVRIYQPHTTTKPKAGIDWAALTPTCRTCGTRTSKLNRDDQCHACAPAPEPVLAPAPAPKQRRARPKKARAPRTGPSGGRPPMELDEAAIVEAYVGGQPASSIAEALGCGPKPILRVLQAAGVELRVGRQRVARRRPSSTNGRPGVPVDEPAIVAEYQAGDTAPEIGRRHGILPKRVRDILTRRGVELRDDRTTRSGSKPKEYDADVCLAVERLYVREQLSQSQVAARLGLTVKVVQSIMKRRGVRAREGQSGSGDTLGGLRAELEALDVTSRQVKEWALERGLIDHLAVGLPSKALVAAYAAAARGDG